MSEEKTFKCFTVTKALATRALFAAHGLIATWRVTYVMDSSLYWILLLSLGGLGVETVVTMVTNKGEEWKWFCPSVFFYLSSLIPCIWFLELDLLEKRLESLDSREAILQGSEYIWKYVEDEDWALAMEQILLFILIIGRWILPKGQITRDQLSQLLLVYIGVAADIIEFFEVFKEDTVKYDRELIIATMTLWTWSLMQFTLVVTVTMARKSRLATSSAQEPKPTPKFKRLKFLRLLKRRRKIDPSDPNMSREPDPGLIIPVRPEDEEREDTDPKCACLESDVWGIVITLVMQDGPFLIFRLILITKYHVVTHMNIFFTIKNILIIVLQVYRIIVLQIEKKDDDNDESVINTRDMSEGQSHFSVQGHQSNSTFEYVNNRIIQKY
ncbi:transmembrane protein 26-like [Ptychodera flava]|uniref:transmembrane protein 26-like n=1 Tax=Ptychodera flava TaxID=63121 RepID=UPI00396A7A43